MQSADCGVRSLNRRIPQSEFRIPNSEGGRLPHIQSLFQHGFHGVGMPVETEIRRVRTVGRVVTILAEQRFAFDVV